MTLLHRRETRRAILAAADKARSAGKLKADEHRQLRRMMFLRPGAADELCELIEEDLIATEHLTVEGDTVGIDWDGIIQRIIDEFLPIIIEFIKSWLGGLGGN